MDDCCAVCAEPLEWVAYGPCGHRDVCSTCVVRLRNVCDDRRCCICKTECNLVFITKAMGDYTKTIDFSSLPVDVREGQVRSYWYHEATQAFFDDVDHYRMIKAMCTFSCSICDKEGNPNDGSRRKNYFRNLEQLKGHLYHRHKRVMCRLCLAGRKVFICEQKLYTKVQLNQHISTGDSEVDGTESERGGFMGHPACEFCRTPYYGENELYTHMSTEHYTCHICQRQNPGQFEYYRNYDDLEIHFRQDHYLCEDEGCLAKKFTVFQSEAELKRHNAIEHAGRMSRSQRNAVLQIPTSFRYRRPNDAGSRRGRGRGLQFREDSTPDNHLSMAIQASLDNSNANTRSADPLPSSSNAQHDYADDDIDPLVPPLESLAVDSQQPPSRYLQAVSLSYMTGPIENSSFPPLPAPPNNAQQRPQQNGNSLPQNTMAARLRQKNKNKVTVVRPLPTASRGPNFPAISSIHPRPTMINTPSVPGYRPTNPVTPAVPTSSSRGPNFPAISSIHPRPTMINRPVPGYYPPDPVTPAVPTSSNYATPVQARPAASNGLGWGGSSSIQNASSSGKMKHSTSAPKLGGSGSFDPMSDFPPVSAAQTQKPAGSSSQPVKAVNVEDVKTANKSLVERVRAALDHDQDKYAAFKKISQEYRLGSVDTSGYFEYIKQFGLLDLVPDLASLCPDPQKQKELLDTYSSALRINESQDLFWGSGSIRVIEKKNKSKGKKPIDSDTSKPKESLADSVLETVRRLQSNYRHEGEVEVLEKDGYRASNAGSSKPSSKKTSKFLRARLGDGSVGALLDLRNPANDPVQDSTDSSSDGKGVPVRGVWRSGGGQKLISTTKK